MPNIPRLLNLPTDSQKSAFLFGPRGTGKTSWLKQHCQGDELLYIDLLDVDDYIPLQRDPKHLTRIIPSDYTGWIVIDEVQKLPALLNEVHRLIESKRYRFILTGSSARSLRKKGVNLLAGRALEYHMFPLTALELGKQFELTRALQYGHLPSILSETDPEHYLQTYVKTYLQEEVMQEGLTRNLSAFSNFLRVASFSQGSLLNVSGIAREIGVDAKTIHNYFDLLDDLLLGQRLPVFSQRARRKMVVHPKFYFFDVGVYRSLRPAGPLDSETEINGIAMESLLLQELRAINAYLRLGYSFYFWRTAQGQEVDFIAYGKNGLLAFEVKSKAYVDRSDLRGLKAFKEDFPVAKCYLIYNGTRVVQDGEITFIPMDQALLVLDEMLENES